MFYRAFRHWSVIGIVIVIFWLIHSNFTDANDVSSLEQEFNSNLFCVSRDKLGPYDSEPLLYIYTWAEYIPQEIIEAFEKITNIKVFCDSFDSNELLEIKLMSNKSRYDLVTPTLTPFFARQLSLDIFQPLNPDSIPDLNTFDHFIMNKLKIIDPELKYAIPYAWGIAGFAINEEILDRIYPDAPKDSWSLMFDAKHASKISAKGNISLSNSPSEVCAIIGNYMFGEEFTDTEHLNAAFKKLGEIRKYIFKFNPSAVNDLLNGTSCVAFGSAADLRYVLLDKNVSNNNNINKQIKFIFPKEGGLLWIDVIAIPKSAKHTKNAHAFLKYIFQPKVIAEITNRTATANAVIPSKTYIKASITNDEAIYPTKEMLSRSFLEKVGTTEYDRARTKCFTKLKAGL